MKNLPQAKITLITGLALFAMFFGAGNIIFPLKIGVMSGQHTLSAILAFVITGVGVPFLGLFAVALYEGNYWEFFRRFGKIPAFLIILFLILIIGPLFATPRTEIVTYSTLSPVLPDFFKNPYLFNAIYCSIIFCIVYRASTFVDVIGGFLSPIKITAFLVLMALGIYEASPLITVPSYSTEVFHSSLTMGYGTMDLLGAFFFCAVAYKNILAKSQQVGITTSREMMKMTLSACVIGALLISSIYAGLIYTAASHAVNLQNVPTENLIGKLSLLVLGEYGAVFVGVCVSFACLATASALVEVTTEFFYNLVLQKKIPRLVCLTTVLMITYGMAILGFGTIMKIAGPILNIIYPVLILFCLLNIYLKLSNKKLNFVKIQAETLS